MEVSRKRQKKTTVSANNELLSHKEPTDVQECLLVRRFIEWKCAKFKNYEQSFGTVLDLMKEGGILTYLEEDATLSNCRKQILKSYENQIRDEDVPVQEGKKANMNEPDTTHVGVCVGVDVCPFHAMNGVHKERESRQKSSIFYLPATATAAPLPAEPPMGKDPTAEPRSTRSRTRSLSTSGRKRKRSIESNSNATVSRSKK